MAHEEFEDALPLYAVGALDRHERQGIDAHLLSGCTACHTALREYQTTAAQLPRALSAARPPQALKQRIMAAAFQPVAPPVEPAKPARRAGPAEPPAWVRHIQPPLTTRMIHPALAAGLVLVFLGVGYYAWYLQTQMSGLASGRERVEAELHDALERAAALQRTAEERQRQLVAMREQLHAGNAEVLEELTKRDEELAQVRASLTQRDQEMATLRKTLVQRDEMLTFLRSAQVKVVSLSGLDRARSAGAFLLYDQETKKAFFYGFNLPSLPPGKTYQLWAIVDRPISAGTFAADAGAKSRLVIRNLPDLASITKFAVSVEPEGGRPQPTGDIYLAGHV